MSIEPHIGSRRVKSWWEPFFRPEWTAELLSCDWNFDTNNGPRKSYLAASALSLKLTDGEVHRVTKITFSDCDFQGEFIHKPSILFEACHFDNCDFAFSTWMRATFRKCTFTSCSIALASFNECEFRDCIWERMGFSGHKTEFNRTVVTNPQQLTEAGFSGRDPTKIGDKEHASYQAFRLEATKANLARGLLVSHESVGDDKTYYETARLHDLQQAWARVCEARHQLRFGKKRRWVSGLCCLMWSAEHLLLKCIGFVNGWGVSLLRPLAALLVVFLTFAFLYRVLGTTPFPGQSSAWQMAFDIGTITGYGNADSALRAAHLKVWGDAQLIISIFLYTIFFSTAVARFSRAR